MIIKLIIKYNLNIIKIILQVGKRLYISFIFKHFSIPLIVNSEAVSELTNSFIN